MIPPHATHFMGVTDKTCHGPYHVRYSRYEKLHLKDDIYITWADYVGMATRSYYESFTPLNLINGFRSRGLWPINAAEPLEAMKNVEPSEKKKKSQREIRSMKRKLDLALFELPSELKEKKQRLGPVARVKVFGGCLTSNEVESAFKAQTTERHEAAQRALAKQLAVAMGKDVAELHKEYGGKVKPLAQALSQAIAASKPRAPRRRAAPPRPTSVVPTAPSLGLDLNASLGNVATHSSLPTIDPFCLSLLAPLDTTFQLGGGMQGLDMLGLSSPTPSSLLPMQVPLQMPYQVPMLDAMPSLQPTMNTYGYDIFSPTFPLNPSLPMGQF